MGPEFLYGLLSVFIISLISLVGLAFLSIKNGFFERMLLIAVSFSAGALLGDALFHLLPEAVNGAQGLTFEVAIYTLTGILLSFVIEKFIHWRHCHIPTSQKHPHSFAYVNLFGDGVHNFIDGMIIAASYLVSIPVGIATTIAVVLHEIPQEIGDFGVLLHGKMSVRKALGFNFLTALTAVLGFIITFWISGQAQQALKFLVPFAAGSFIYIASSDLIPELHKETRPLFSMLQFGAIIAGLAIMSSLLLLE